MVKIQKIKDWEFYQKLVRFILFIFIIFLALLYLGALIVPNWEVFILFPIAHQIVAYLTIGVIVFFICVIIIVFISLAVEKQVLEQDNEHLQKTVDELEAKLEILKKKG